MVDGQKMSETFDPGSFTAAVDERNLERFLELINNLESENCSENPLDVLCNPVFGKGVPLLHYLCGQQDIDLQFIVTLLHKEIDVNLLFKQRRPVHVACQENCPETLQILLDHGANIIGPGEEVWEENSPLYIASICGYIDIVRILFSDNPRLVREEDVRSCLLYAACCGGNKDIVSMWYSPAMDINQPKPFIQALDDSGDNTPMFAACSNGHYEIAKYLFDLGARLSHRVCTDFPEITGQILEDCVQEALPGNLENERVTEETEEIMHQAEFTKLELSAFHPDWLRACTVTLVTLNINNNNLEELPDMVPWSFPNLESFYASHNLLKSLTFGKEPLVCFRLKTIRLNNNKLKSLCSELFQIPSLETLNLSYNELQYLVKEHQMTKDWEEFHEQDPQGSQPKSQEWDCEKLNRLNLSYNCLNMLPANQIKQCTGLTTLDASHNCLTFFCGGWDCNMTNLDLSYNELERFPADVEMFWCGSLHILNLDHNKLEILPDGIVKLCALTDLIVSNNLISILPDPDIWDCRQLYLLNLYNNMLGLPYGSGTPAQHSSLDRLRRRMSTKSEHHSSLIVLPKFLAYCLHILNLGDNHLDFVPKGICHLSSLATLILSKNSGIKSLPDEIGQLTSLTSLQLDNTSVKLSSSISEDPYQRTQDIVVHHQHKLRKSKHYNKIKLVILGKKDKGKTTLAGLLCGKKFHGSGIHRCEFKLPASIMPSTSLGQKIKGWSNNHDITFSMWDMASSDQYVHAQQCFFTQNSLYILVWDISSLKRELEKLGNWLYSIEARTPQSKVILVATFLDKDIYAADRDKQLSQIIDAVIDRYGHESSSHQLCSQLDRNNIIPVSCTTKEGITLLKQRIYDLASRMQNPANRQGTLLSRKVPQSYISIEKAVEQKLAEKRCENQPPFMEEKEFQELVTSLPDNDITTDDELKAVTQFLVETGSLLHFSDQLRGLNTLYILDPSWLCELLAKVFLDSDNGTPGKIGGDGKISLTEVMKIYTEDENFPEEFIGQYLQLLERFEIALSVDNDRRLFIPSMLSKVPGMQLEPEKYGGTNVCRLYQMAFIPTGFWSRLLSRMMARLELLEQPKWLFQSSAKGNDLSMAKSICHSRLQHTVVGRQFSGGGMGLHIKKKDMIYWQDGMRMRHEKGYFKLEAIRVPQGRDKPPQHGILITVHSVDEEFSILGMIVDEIDDLLADHYPGLLDWDDFGQPRVQRYALCQLCFDIDSSTLPPSLDHFTVEHCSRLLLTTDTIQCKTGALVPLYQLVPELLIQEIPKEYHIDKNRLTVNLDGFLGRGVTGSVYKGTYGDMKVAVKYYHGMPGGAPSSGTDSIDSGKHTWPKGGENENSAEIRRKKIAEENPYGNYNDNTYKNYREIKENIERRSHDLKENPYGNFQEVLNTFDTDEANSIKAWKSFMEMRQEVAVTSKLKHPCVISFIGISVEPKLLMCLEFAPLGNLRSVLDYLMTDRRSFNKYRDRDRLFSMILSKNMTYKVVFQIACGLQYLHKHGIIYRDLKSDNILVTTLDPTAPVNVKLSDYGISKFYSSGGTMGVVGTPGYQAPEIMDGQFYDAKVDIFSFAMVVYEVMSGKRPYGEFKTMAQISSAIKHEAKRPCLKSYNIDSRFPQLESLMEKCWQDKGIDRPSAVEIVTDNLRNVHFICQHKIFDKKHGETYCMTGVTDGKKQLIWLWEGTESERFYHIIDLTSCTYHEKKHLSGPTVTCMCKVDKEIWVGSEEGIEVFGQHTSGQLQRECKLKCDGIPTSILYIDKTEKTEKKICVLLHDGMLRVYTLSKHNTNRSVRKEVTGSGWSCVRPSQRLSHAVATCSLYVTVSDMLWIGCGPEIVLYSNNTSLVEGRIPVGKILQTCVHDSPDKVEVQAMVQADGRIWCLLENTAFIFEFDSESGIPTHIYNCNEQQPTGMVISKEVCMDEIERTKSTPEEELSTQTDCDGNPPPVPPRMSTVSTTDSETDSIGDLPPSRPPRPRRDRVNSDPGELRPMITTTRTTRENNRPGFSTLPHLPRCYSVSNVTVNSLAVVNDALWVSRSHGDIIIISTCESNSFKRGEVITVLKCRSELVSLSNAHQSTSVEGLLSINNLVVSVIREDLTSSHLVAWEAYNCTDIRTIRRYWNVKGDKHSNTRYSRPRLPRKDNLYTFKEEEF